MPQEDIIKLEERANQHDWQLFEPLASFRTWERWTALLIPPHRHGSRKVWRPLAKMKSVSLFVPSFSSFLLDLVTFPDLVAPPSIPLLAGFAVSNDGHPSLEQPQTHRMSSASFPYL